MPLGNPRSGISYAAEFQASSIPWVLQSSVAASGVNVHSFPFVTKFVSIQNTSSRGSMRVGFTYADTVGTKYKTIPAGELFTFSVRCENVFILGVSSNQTYVINAGLTGIAADVAPVASAVEPYDPYTTTSITGNWDASGTGVLFEDSPPTVSATDGDPVGAWNDYVTSVKQEYYASSLSTRPQLTTSGPFGGGLTVRFDGVDDFLNGTPGLATFLDADGWSLYIVFSIVSFTGGSSDAFCYNSPAIVSDSASNWGVHVTTSGGNAIQVYEYDVTVRCNRHTVVANTPYVLSVVSGGSVLKSRLNGGTQISQAVAAASPNPLSGGLRCGRNYLSAYANVDIAQIIASDALHSDAEESYNVSGLMTKWGIS